MTRIGGKNYADNLHHEIYDLFFMREESESGLFTWIRRRFCLRGWIPILSTSDRIQTPDYINCQVKDVVARKSNRMTYNPFIENAFHKQVNANFWRYIHSHCPSLNKGELAAQGSTVERRKGKCSQ